jgi:hypothetical protein
MTLLKSIETKSFILKLEQDENTKLYTVTKDKHDSEVKVSDLELTEANKLFEKMRGK